MLRKPASLILASLTLIFLVMLSFATSAAEKPGQRVLFVSSYHPQPPPCSQQIKGIKSVFKPLDILLDIEFMDTNPFVHGQNLVNLHSSLAYKLAHSKPYDAIIAGDDAALRFAIGEQQQPFSQKPIVFSGVNNLRLARSQNDNGYITGVVEEVAKQENSPNQYVFDCRQLLPYGIDGKNLPRNSVLLHQPLGYFQIKKAYLGLWAAIVLGLLLVISFLLLHIRGQKRYETALQESEARYRAIIEDQTDLVCRNRPEGTLTFVNQAFCRYFGQECHNLVGSNLLPMVAVADQARVKEYFAGIGTDNPVATYQCQVVAADGGIRWMQWTSRAIFDPCGQVVELQSVGRDISKQKRVETNLRDREQFLSSILAAAPIGMGVTKNRNLVWVSDNLCKLLGYEPSELLQRSARMLYESGQEFEQVGRIKYLDIASHGIGRLETRWVKKDGQAVDILLSSALIDPLDQTVGTTFTAMDITDKKRADQALQKALTEAREARDQIEIMLRSVADGLIFTDKNNNIILMSDSAEAILGKSRAEVLAKPVTAVFDCSPLIEQLNRLSRGDDCAETAIEIELPGQNHGPVRAIQTKSSAVMGAEGATAGVITLLRDVSQERALDRLKSEFISTAAHELRTPLTSVMGFSELLLSQKEFKNTEHLEFLKIIHRKSEVLGKIIDDMLDLARLDSGQVIQIDKSLIDTGKLIRRCIAEYQSTFPSHRFVGIDLDELPPLLADDRKICHVLENLLNNAVNFSAAGSLVQVTCETRKNEVYIVVQDEGIGMTPEQVEKVFDKFYRVDASNTAKGGLGLGLAIVKGIIEAHGGRIWIESEVDRGTKVAFTLPLLGATV